MWHHTKCGRWPEMREIDHHEYDPSSGWRFLSSWSKICFSSTNCSSSTWIHTHQLSHRNGMRCCKSESAEWWNAIIAKRECPPRNVHMSGSWSGKKTKIQKYRRSFFWTGSRRRITLNIESTVQTATRGMHSYKNITCCNLATGGAALGFARGSEKATDQGLQLRWLSHISK